MKIERSGPSRGVRATGAPPYARRAEASVAPASSVAVGATANVLGIPESEFTPRVRDAIVMLMGEVDTLRRQLAATQARLDEAEKNADQDQLLPLLNRRAFVRELTRTIAYAGRYGTPASLIYFDLNGFKAINDSFGH